jgi:predicted DNA binding CopG/RHH family protein
MVERTAEPKHTFSIQLPSFLYQKVLEKAGKRGIGALIREVLEKELASEGEQLKQQLISDYQSVAESKKAQKEAEI